VGPDLSGVAKLTPVAWLLLLLFPENYQPSISSSPRKSWSSGNVTPEKQRDGWLFFAVTAIDDQPKSWNEAALADFETSFHSSTSIAKPQGNTPIGNANGVYSIEPRTRSGGR
jgi:hypothetical protein